MHNRDDRLFDSGTDLAIDIEATFVFFFFFLRMLKNTQEFRKKFLTDVKVRIHGEFDTTEK